ncbi:phenylacetic acid degradation operon negative regulatory protein PaaX [Halomonas sp. MCCC 1A17488]|uniref:phenylacetic acid degradation operon negative regulatory protein PaaX n=1 Tax=unclassified Halomonas TaxID=2609666 RepID=UPI0018D210CB|nr:MULTISPECIES: phenylacetic acid degradation operon negative regulatory protein PaaX [unclassified Halomonas]MCE8017177.1 phenylacetic acid degradation operon negative regulatory protein PaaX [Halomonas sp. MCCC 1A17488]MCG3240510.1 phenylacetic acid degradation operon negative regulatory protein PaaX [Halomonas sp. MCCC 1A17488]QPP49633.1 phenylacetic acid degradation operon negative regulatory protein PaaX [Halomonas sp. SS10-MC5]
MPSATECVASLIDNFQSRRPLRSGSLIITLYGDAIVPRGGTVWLGSISQLLEPIGINERLVRTSVYRLTQETWLQGEKVGRRSYYSLSGPGRRRFEQAFKRVYHGNGEAWDGGWTLVFLGQLDAGERTRTREELEWQGFGAFANGVLAHPRKPRSEALGLLQELGVVEDAIVLRSEASDPLASKALRLQVRESWNLDQLAESYNRFLAQFRPLWKSLSESQPLGDQDAFIARTLLIHEYRKVQLRDPQLPEELLPTAWEGRNARQLCRNIYREIYQGAERWLDRHLETAEGPLPAPGHSFYQRFGGLE